MMCMIEKRRNGSTGKRATFKRKKTLWRKNKKAEDMVGQKDSATVSIIRSNMLFLW